MELILQTDVLFKRNLDFISFHIGFMAGLERVAYTYGMGLFILIGSFLANCVWTNQVNSVFARNYSASSISCISYHCLAFHCLRRVVSGPLGCNTVAIAV